MCALCAVLGSANHWSDMAGHSEFHHDGNKVTRRVERNRRLHILEPILSYYGLQITDLNGSSYLISAQPNKSEEVYQLDDIWRVASELSDHVLDPLNRDLLNYLNRNVS